MLLFLLFLFPFARAQSSCDALLFAYFTGDESLYYALSFDGFRWLNLNYNQPVLKCSIPNTSIRDPYLHVGQNGVYYLVATDGYNFGGNPNILTWSTKNLIDFSEETVLPVMANFSGVADVWAPEWAFDSVSKRYMIFWAVKFTSNYINDTGCSSTNQQRFKFWYSWTTDFQTFTDPLILFDPGCNIDGDGGIDGDLVQDSSGLWNLFFKDARGTSESVRGIRRATSFSINGPYVNISDLVSPTLVEGPEVIQFAYPGSNSLYYLYYDCSFYSTPSGWPRPPYGVSTSPTLNGTFTVVSGSCTGQGAIESFPSDATHGSFLCLTQQQANALITQYVQ